MTQPTERRSRPFKRAMHDMAQDYFSVLGKLVCLYLLLAFSEELIDREFILIILLTALIAPDILRKVLAWRVGARDDEPKGAVTKTKFTGPATMETEVTQPANPKRRRVDNEG